MKKTATDLSDIYKANLQFFHMFCEMFRTGDVAKMGSHALATYMTIKAFSNMNTGKGFPSIETIVKESGVSRAQVKRSMRVLEEMGYIEVTRRSQQGLSNVYTLKEKFTLTDSYGDVTATATFDYIPTLVKEAMAEIKNFSMTGDGKTKYVHIDNLVMNIQINKDCHNVHQNNAREAYAKFKKWRFAERLVEGM